MCVCVCLPAAGLEVFCIGGGAPAPSPEAQACRDANLSGLHELLAQVSPPQVSAAGGGLLPQTHLSSSILWRCWLTCAHCSLCLIRVKGSWGCTGGRWQSCKPVGGWLHHDCFCTPHLCAQVSGQYKGVPRPVDMSALFTIGSVSATGFLFPFKIGTHVTIQVRQQPAPPDVPRWWGVQQGPRSQCAGCC